MQRQARRTNCARHWERQDFEHTLSMHQNRHASSLKLTTTKQGYPMTAITLRGAFDRAREQAANDHPELSESIKSFQFRDLRAKAGTDKEEIAGISAAQDQPDHTTPTMTVHYVRHRRGKPVKPTK